MIVLNIEKDFEEIENYAHFWRCLPDSNIVEKIYKTYQDSYSVLTPFAYTYLEELIRTLTSFTITRQGWERDK